MNKENMKIDTSYGNIQAIEPDGNCLKAKSINELLETLESRIDNYNNPTVNVTTYANDDDSISDAMDLTMAAILCCWGKQLYHGDAIKITITAEYMPEEK